MYKKDEELKNKLNELLKEYDSSVLFLALLLTVFEKYGVDISKLEKHLKGGDK